MFIKNLKIKKRNKKLDYIKIRPFFIKTKKKAINYKLELSQDIKKYI